MDAKKVRNALLAMIGLGGLAACILACTSFSPDDKKILYSTFDPKTRSMAVAVYDRASAKSETLFASNARSGEMTEPEPVLMRSQWLPDGKHVIVSWLPVEESKEGDGIARIAVISLDRKEPFRLVHLKGVGESGATAATWPMPVVGSRVFVNAESNRVISLDLLTGAASVRTNQQEMAVYASTKTDRLAFFAKSGADRMQCGEMVPDTFAREWQVELDEGVADFRSFAFSPEGRKVAVVPDRSGEPVLFLYEEGKPSKRLVAPHAKRETLELGQVAFTVNGKALVVVFLLEAEGKDSKSLGILELPLDGAAPKRTLLLVDAELKDDSTLNLIQFGLSHDGKALAASTAYVAAANPDLRHEDCALFIVDLTSASRRCKRIPIPFPTGLGKIGN